MVDIVGADIRYERAIRKALSMYPSWYVAAANISRISVTISEEVRAQAAMYRHGIRDILVYPNLGMLLNRAIGHELAHGIDDVEGVSPHYFSSNPAWIAIHKGQAHFDIPKYRDEPLEHFADMMVKFVAWGEQKLRIGYPNEVWFILAEVIPKIRETVG